MSGEIVEPEVERVKLSLAEENLIEQIRNYILKLIPLVQDTKNVLMDLSRHMFEGARSRAAKIREDFKTIHALRFELVRYSARLAVPIAYSSYYLSLVDTLTHLTNSLYKLATYLEYLGYSQIALLERVSTSIQNAMERLASFLSDICTILKYLIESPSKVPNTVSLIQKNWEELMQIIKDLYEGLGQEKAQGPLLLVASTAVDIASGVYVLGEKTLCLYIVRKV